MFCIRSTQDSRDVVCYQSGSWQSANVMRFYVTTRDVNHIIMK